MKLCGIYLIRNKRNGNRYIGSSKDTKRRWKEHFFNLQTGLHINTYLQNAYNKYGAEAFEFSIIEECSESILIEREQYWIDAYIQMEFVLYNINLKAELPPSQKGKIPWNKGLKMPPETCLALSIAHKGFVVAEETKRKISEGNKGKIRLVETCLKIAAAKTGKPMSEQHRANTSKNHANMSGQNNPFYGKHHTEESKEKNRQAHKKTRDSE